MSSIIAAVARTLLQTNEGPRCEPNEGFLYTDHCHPGTLDCCNGHPIDGKPVPQLCAEYDGVYAQPQKLSWVLVTAFFTTALMAFGIGANDAANAWGACVGSGAIPLLQAVVLGGLMDWLGATTLGAGVSDTIRQGIAEIDDPSCWACGYCNSSMSLYMLGMMVALLATAVFLLLASYTAMPVSTTHAIVGAIVGVTIVGTWGRGCDVGSGLPQIVASWVISPVFSGLLGATQYCLLHRFIIMAPDSEGTALRACPWLYAATVFIMTALILMKSTLTKNLEGYWVGIIAMLSAGLTYALVRLFLVAEIARRIRASVAEASAHEAHELELAAATNKKFSIADDDLAEEAQRLMQPHSSGQASPRTPRSLESGNSQPSVATPPSNGLHSNNRKSPNSMGLGGVQHPTGGLEIDANQEDCEDLWAAVLPNGPPPASPRAIGGMFAGESYTVSQEHALFVFRYLLVFVAALEAFAHGANDTGNATGAFSAVWTTFRDGLSRCDDNPTPVWITCMGGFFIFLGNVFFGGRVIQTMGFGLTDINFLRGFCIESSAAASVVLATIMGMPVSTTHCQVGAVIFVGWMSFGFKHVKWNMFGRIVLTWIVTLPLSAGLAATLFLILKRHVMA